MDVESLKNRFKQLALSVVHFAEKLPNTITYRTIKGQMARSGTSAAANYRASCRRKSPKDFIAKMGIVEEDLDETMFWLEFTVAVSEIWRPDVAPIWKEADELLAITVSSIKTSKNNRSKDQKTPKS